MKLNLLRRSKRKNNHPGAGRGDEKRRELEEREARVRKWLETQAAIMQRDWEIVQKTE